MPVDQSEAEAAVQRLAKWCDLMEAPPPPEGYAESDDYIHALVYDDAPVDVVLSDDIRLLLAERRGLREALEKIAREGFGYQAGVASTALQGKGGDRD